MKTATIVFILFSCLCVRAQNRSRELGYEQPIFDSDTCCWRKLAKNNEYEKAGDLIVSYLKNNKKLSNIHALHWHAGQMFAKAQNDRLAVHYFRKTYNFLYKWFGGEDGKTWYYYAKGTVAFIERDQEKLSKIIKAWDKNLPKDRNYSSLVRLYKNWDSKYLEATEP